VSEILKAKYFGRREHVIFHACSRRSICDGVEKEKKGRKKKKMLLHLSVVVRCRGKKGCRCAVRVRVMVELLFERLLVVVREIEKKYKGK
jgi:hypothetical protein